jgi:hypothetical protein
MSNEKSHSLFKGVQKMKKTMLVFFLGLVLAAGGLRADDEKERAWELKMEQVQRMLQENGAREDIVERILRDMAERRERMEIEERELENESWDEVQGLELGVNTFYGYLAGNAITSGTGNSFFGRSAGASTTSGNWNTILGHKAGSSNTNGFQNIFIGNMSGNKNIEGAYNIFVGANSGCKNTNGDANTCMGDAAGLNNTSGYANTYIGCGSGCSNTTGNFNICMGIGAGGTKTGNRNVIIGSYAGGGGNDPGASGNIFIGDNAGWAETGSNKLYIDNSNTTTPLIYGNFDTNRIGINNSVPGYMFCVGTSGAYCNGHKWVDGSSREFKENIEALTPMEALRTFAGLEPVKFNYKEDKGEACLGFIAEDVPELVATNDRKGLSPMDIVAVLTKVVQEQQKLNQEQQDKISFLEARLSALERKETEKK